MLTLGASYRRSGPNGTYQAADALYYASGGYYVGLTLYQMWPVEVGGRPYRREPLDARWILEQFP